MSFFARICLVYGLIKFVQDENPSILSFMVDALNSN